MCHVALRCVDSSKNVSECSLPPKDRSSRAYQRVQMSLSHVPPYDTGLPDATPRTARASPHCPGIVDTYARWQLVPLLF
eukprot:scaffold1598_cov139-Skeletonema_marinoi.AAC.2